MGRASRVFEMAKFLDKHHDVTVITPFPTIPFNKFDKAHFPSKENFNGVKIERLNSFQPNHSIPSFFERNLYWISFPILCSLFLFKRLHKISTIIVSTPPMFPLLVTLVARLYRKRVIIDIGDLWDTHEGKNPKLKFLRSLMKKLEIYSWRKADLILTNHRILQDRIRKILGKKYFSKVEFLPYNVDIESFRKQNVDVENQIVYLGSYVKFYNIKVLLKAMEIVKKEIPDLKLQLYGGGNEEILLKKLSKELHIENCCFFNNPIPKNQVPMILSKSKLGIIPYTIYEEVSHGFPTKAKEYMSCSLPVFAFGPSGELKKVLNESQAGVFVEGNDPEKIAKELISLIKDKKALEIYSKNARKFVENSTDFSHIAELI